MIVTSKIEKAKFRFHESLLNKIFFVIITTPKPHYDPGVDSTSNINEYQEYFWG
jgi:hypothetical protein